MHIIFAKNQLMYKKDNDQITILDCIVIMYGIELNVIHHGKWFHGSIKTTDPIIVKEPLFYM